jgi:hypothetical protein
MCFPLFAAGIVVDIINHFEKIGLDLDCFFLEKIGLFPGHWCSGIEFPDPFFTTSLKIAS